jgi:hypothetical protein
MRAYISGSVNEDLLRRIAATYFTAISVAP